jgi:hypothetical protein
VDVTVLPSITVAALQNALREGANADLPRPFHVLHFIGHGRYDVASSRNTLLFEGEQGEVDEVDAERLVTIVRPYDLRLVFLNACQSMQSSAMAAARGFAPALLRIGVPAAIGMQLMVLDATAARFSSDFYAALADNQPVDASPAAAGGLRVGAARVARTPMRVTVHRSSQSLQRPSAVLPSTLGAQGQEVRATAKLRSRTARFSPHRKCSCS